MQPFSGDQSDDKMGNSAAAECRSKRGAEIAMANVMMQRRSSMSPQTGREARLMFRRGEFSGPTSGLAPNYGQGNLVILPSVLAGDFLRFCQLNPKPCPLIAVSSPGEWQLSALADDVDIRTDLPRYRVWRHGAIVDEPQDLLHWWRDDLVSFV